MKPNYSPSSAALYADTETPVLPKTEMTLDLARTALVVIDPQIDVMSPKGLAWPAVGESVTENNLVPNLVEQVTHLEENVGAVALTLSDAEFAALNEVGAAEVFIRDLGQVRPWGRIKLLLPQGTSGLGQCLPSTFIGDMAASRRHFGH